MWTKSRKISAAVLGLAAVAFGVDRFVLSGGQGAAADAASEYAVSNSSPASASTTTAAQPKQDGAAAAPAASAAVTLASRLSAMAEARRFQYETSGDAFRPSDAWLISAAPPAPVAKAAKPDSTAAPKAAKIDPVAEFAKRHTLTAIMTKRNGGMAIVDGKLYEPGQTIDGFKLTKVSETEATFSAANGRKVTLKLPGQPMASAR